MCASGKYGKHSASFSSGKDMQRGEPTLRSSKDLQDVKTFLCSEEIEATSSTSLFLERGAGWA